MVRWICSVNTKDKISTEKFRSRLKLKNMGECLQDIRIQWLVIWEERKKELDLVNVEAPRSVVSSPNQRVTW